MSGCIGESAVIPRSSAPYKFEKVAASDALYVANSTINVIAVYDSGSSTPTRNLQLPKLAAPSAIAFDSSGNTYIANYGGGPRGDGSISIFRPGEMSAYRAIRRGIGWPMALAFDAHRKLNVANTHVKTGGGHLGAGSVTVYPVASGKPVNAVTWRDGICDPWSVIFDRAGNRYVASHWDCSGYGMGSVNVFSPSSNSPIRTIRKGVRQPRQLLLDKAGNLYVANGFGGISIYPPGASTPRTVIDPSHAVLAIAIDSDGKLYELSRSVFVYPSGKTKPSQEIKLSDSVSMSLDSHDNLYVGSDPNDCGKVAKRKNYGCVLVFAHGTLRQRYRILIPGTPAALAFGPP